MSEPHCLVIVCLVAAAQVEILSLCYHTTKRPAWPVRREEKRYGSKEIKASGVTPDIGFCRMKLAWMAACSMTIVALCTVLMARCLCHS
jgi:hypothetical protein